MQHITSYNEREVVQNGKKDDIKSGYNVWVDLADPTPAELLNIQRSFHLDKKAVEEYTNKSKKPQIRILDSHKFIVILDIKYKDAKTLLTEGIYMFSGKGWLVTIHSSNIDLMAIVYTIFEQKNRPVLESPIDVLYYSILSNIIDKYEQLLTAIELSVTDFEHRSLYRPTRKMLEYLDTLSRQVIILRRHFWHMRDITNFLKNIEEDKESGKYLRIVYDDITQLIEMVESYRDSINSTRELYIASVSLQMNDTVKTLTLFSAILLPLTFLSSVYGMNGLDLRNLRDIPLGFVVVIITMAIIAAVLFVFFKRKDWILTKEEQYDPHHNNNDGEKGRRKEEKESGKHNEKKLHDNANR